MQNNGSITQVTTAHICQPLHSQSHVFTHDDWWKCLWWRTRLDHNTDSYLWLCLSAETVLYLLWSCHEVFLQVPPTVLFRIVQKVTIVHHHAARLSYAMPRHVCHPVQSPQYSSVPQVEVCWKWYRMVHLLKHPVDKYFKHKSLLNFEMFIFKIQNTLTLTPQKQLL